MIKKKVVKPTNKNNTAKGRRTALLSKADEITRFMRIADPKSAEFGRARARLAEINAQLYR